MIRYARPPRPKDFPTRRIQDACAALAAAGGACETAELWGDYKDVFSEAQHGKCAWCEAVDTTEPGAVDHYAPKKEVGRLMTPGQERPKRTNVQGRSIVALHAPGYWWLAYDWDNWLFACNRCNSGWKLTLFPVQEVPHPRPDPTTAYTPLLLHPYETEEPLEHLDISDIGQIEAWNLSPKGRATIDTCGLTRESLRRLREKHAEVALAWVDELLNEDAAESTRQNAWRALRRLGDDSKPFAATTRSVIRRYLKISWADLEEVPIR